MRIILDIRDDLITQWGSIYLHAPSYDFKNTSLFVPGFRWVNPKNPNERSAFDLRIAQTNAIQLGSPPMQIKQPAPTMSSNDKKPDKESLENKIAGTISPKDGSAKQPAPAPKTDTSAQKTDMAIPAENALNTKADTENKPGAPNEKKK